MVSTPTSAARASRPIVSESEAGEDRTARMSLTLGSSTEFTLQSTVETTLLEKILEHARSCCSAHAAGTPIDGDSVSLKDPVCGMTVTPRSPHRLEHEGKPIYFCSAGCKAKFAAEPAKYLVEREKADEEP